MISKSGGAQGLLTEGLCYYSPKDSMKPQLRLSCFAASSWIKEMSSRMIPRGPLGTLRWRWRCLVAHAQLLGAQRLLAEGFYLLKAATG